MTRSPGLLAATAAISLALTACGGGGGGVASMPPPAPPPQTASDIPADYIVGATSGSEAFAGKGAAIRFDGSTSDVLGTSLAAGDQLKVRFDAGSGEYQVQLPSGATWERIFLNPNEVPNTRDLVTAGTSPVNLQLEQFASTGYRYSALVAWAANVGTAGETDAGLAIGIPTPAGGVPTTGSASYNGSIVGHSTELAYDALSKGSFPAFVEGSIKLGFDFGAGTLSGSISPIIYTDDRRSIGTFDFTKTIYSSGSTEFSGQFATQLKGANAFSGQFTGPEAQELIGNFIFPYASPSDGQVYEASGAFVAKQ